MRKRFDLSNSIYAGFYNNSVLINYHFLVIPTHLHLPKKTKKIYFMKAKNRKLKKIYHSILPHYTTFSQEVIKGQGLN
jgi:hypothetical protein